MPGEADRVLVNARQTGAEPLVPSGQAIKGNRMSACAGDGCLVRGVLGTPEPADGAGQGNDQGFPWRDAAVDSVASS